MMKSPGDAMYPFEVWAARRPDYETLKGKSMVSTVGDSLKAFCEEENIAFDAYLESWLGPHVGPGVPPRYRRLVRDVVLRLPQGWDDHAEWTVEVEWEKVPQGYASVLREEEAGGEIVDPYIVTLYPALMDRLSDSACRWVLAHEFGHIASKLRHGSIIINGKVYTRHHGDYYEEAESKSRHEDAADNLPLEWGFDCEWQAFERES